MRQFFFSKKMLTVIKNKWISKNLMNYSRVSVQLLIRNTIVREMYAASRRLRIACGGYPLVKISFLCYTYQLEKAERGFDLEKANSKNRSCC